MPTPPSPLGLVNPLDLPVGIVLHRIHDSRFAGDSFNPCKGQPSRFAPIDDPRGKCIASLYAADSLAAAAFETVFLNIPAKARLKTVRLSDVQSRSHSKIELTRSIKVAKLFKPDLKALRVTKAALIDSLPSHYSRTARWAEAIHNQYTDIEGLVWTSNQCDPDRAFVFFGDRVKVTDLGVISTNSALHSAQFLSDLRMIGARAGITIVT